MMNLSCENTFDSDEIKEKEDTGNKTIEKGDKINLKKKVIS
jgi:hypothetical protein